MREHRINLIAQSFDLDKGPAFAQHTGKSDAVCQSFFVESLQEWSDKDLFVPMMERINRYAVAFLNKRCESETLLFLGVFKGLIKVGRRTAFRYFFSHRLDRGVCEDSVSRAVGWNRSRNTAGVWGYASHNLDRLSRFGRIEPYEYSEDAGQALLDGVMVAGFPVLFAEFLQVA